MDTVNNEITEQLPDDLQRKLSDLEVNAEPEKEVGVNPAYEHLRVDPVEVYRAALTGVFKPTFDVVAPNWNLSKEECDQLAGAYAPVLAKYWPDYANFFGVEFTAVVVTLTIFSSRRGVPFKAEKPKEEIKTDG